MIFAFLLQVLSFNPIQSVSDSVFFWHGESGFIYSSKVDTNTKQVEILANLKKNKVKADKGILARKKNATSHWNLYATNLWYIYDAKGQSVTSKDIIEIEPFENGILKLQTPNGDGLINADAYALTTFDYAEFKRTDGILLGRKANQYFIADAQGKITNQIADVDAIEPISKYIFKTTINKKVGIYDILQNKYILKPIFENIILLKNIGYLIKKKNKFGLLAFDGKVLLPNEFDQIVYDTLSFFKCLKTKVETHEQLSSLKIVDETWSVFNAKNQKMIIENSKEIGNFNNGFYPIFKERLFALYDTSGKQITQEKFKTIQEYRNEVAIGQVGFYYGFADKVGDWIEYPQFSAITYINDTLYIVRKGSKDRFFNMRTRKISLESYEEIKPLENGYYQITQDGYLGLLSPNFKPLIECKFTKIEVLPQYKIILTALINQYSIYYMNGNLKVKMNYPYDKYLPYKSGLAMVSHHGKWGFVNTDGQLIVSTQYDECRDFVNNFAAVRIGKKWGYIDKNENLVVSPYYDEISDFGKGCGGVQKNKKWGFVNHKGREVIVPQYDEAKQTNSGSFVIKNKTKSGYVNTLGYEQVAPTYKDFAELKPNYFKVRSTGKYGLIDSRSTELIPHLYDDIVYDEKDNRYFLFLKGQWQSAK